MAITKVTEGVRTLGTGEVATANMATDPTNASNLSSGSVPLAQLDNAPETDVTGINDDIALLGFKVATNGSLGKYNLVDQTEDAFVDETGIDASASTNELFNTTGYFEGGTLTQTVVTATGAGTYTHAADGPATVHLLVVAGGGGSSSSGWGAGGTGAGGLVYISNYAVAQSTLYNYTVGSGGTSGALPAHNPGGAGGDTVFDSSGTAETITATGGGISGNFQQTAGGGGSGGGNAADGGPTDGALSTQAADFGSYTGVGFGNTGGWVSQGGWTGSGSGGGGAGSAGQAAQGSNASGDGGTGKDYSSVFGTSVGDEGWFSGGGGGGGGTGPAGWGNGGQGYKGGGGNGASSGAGTAGLANTGGGGGGGDNDQLGGVGGSGVIIIRFVTIQDLTLVSASTTAEAVPTKGDMVMTYTNGAGTATLNTDIKGWVSRDNGTTYTQGTLANQGTTGGHEIVTFHDLDISSQPSGSTMRYKVTTHNQDDSKNTRVQAVSLGWS